MELDKVLAVRFYFDYRLYLCSFKYPDLTEWLSSRFQTDVTASVSRCYIHVLLQISSIVIPRFASFIGTTETAGKVKVSETKVIIFSLLPILKNLVGSEGQKRFPKHAGFALIIHGTLPWCAVITVTFIPYLNITQSLTYALIIVYAKLRVM
jgi:hypothetical protein